MNAMRMNRYNYRELWIRAHHGFLPPLSVRELLARDVEFQHHGRRVPRTSNAPSQTEIKSAREDARAAKWCRYARSLVFFGVVLDHAVTPRVPTTALTAIAPTPTDPTGTRICAARDEL